MSNNYSYGIELSDGNIYDIIPPIPSDTVRGGIIAKERTTEETEIVVDYSTGRAYVPKINSSDSSMIEFDTVEVMKSASLNEGVFCQTKGYYSTDDGGFQTYVIKSISDNDFSITLNNGLYACPIIEEYVNIKKFGAKESVSIHAICTSLLSLSQVKTVYIPDGDWLMTDSVTIPQHKSIIGNNSTSKINYSPTVADTYGFVMSSDSEISNLYIYSNETTLHQGSPIYAVGSDSNKKYNIRIHDLVVTKICGIGITVTGCYSSIVKNCEVSYCHFGDSDYYNSDSDYDKNKPIGIWLGGISGNTDLRNIIDGCHLHHNDLDGIICSCHNVIIKNCECDNNGWALNTALYGGALGAAGIFFIDGGCIIRAKILNNMCYNNSEFGINAALRNSEIKSNICFSNQVAGILIKASHNLLVDGNICYENGTYNGSNSIFSSWMSGIMLINNHSSDAKEELKTSDNIIITNNSLYSSSTTQPYAIRFDTSSNNYSSISYLKIYNNDTWGNVDGETNLPIGSSDGSTPNIINWYSDIAVSAIAKVITSEGITSGYVSEYKKGDYVQLDISLVANNSLAKGKRMFTLHQAMIPASKTIDSNLIGSYAAPLMDIDGSGAIVWLKVMPSGTCYCQGITGDINGKTFQGTISYIGK